MEMQQERETIFGHIVNHLEEWAKLVSKPEDIRITKLNGHSNASYPVDLEDELVDRLENYRGCKTVLFKRFE